VDQCVITREITVAAGVFAPGHLGELTQIVPFEMVDFSFTYTKSPMRFGARLNNEEIQRMILESR